MTPSDQSHSLARRIATTGAALATLYLVGQIIGGHRDAVVEFARVEGHARACRDLMRGEP